MNREKLRRVLEPMVFFRNNALDTITLLAENDAKKERACRNLLWAHFNRWYGQLEDNVRLLVSELEEKIQELERKESGGSK